MEAWAISFFGAPVEGATEWNFAIFSPVQKYIFSGSDKATKFDDFWILLRGVKLPALMIRTDLRWCSVPLPPKNPADKRKNKICFYPQVRPERCDYTGPFRMPSHPRSSRVRVPLGQSIGGHYYRWESHLIQTGSGCSSHLPPGRSGVQAWASALRGLLGNGPWWPWQLASVAAARAVRH